MTRLLSAVFVALAACTALAQAHRMRPLMQSSRW